MRISVIGLPASGKSTLARRISQKFSIPHIHIDRFWFEAGGLKVEQGIATPEEREQIRAKVRGCVQEAIKADSWVSDGFYSRIQPEVSARADVIVYLNIPLVTRLLAHAKRMFLPGRHDELTMWHELKFFAEVVYRTIKKGPVIQQFVEGCRGKVIELRSWKEVDNYMTKITV